MDCLLLFCYGHNVQCNVQQCSHCMDCLLLWSLLPPPSRISHYQTTKTTLRNELAVIVIIIKRTDLGWHFIWSLWHNDCNAHEHKTHNNAVTKSCESVDPPPRCTVRANYASHLHLPRAARPLSDKLSIIAFPVQSSQLHRCQVQHLSLTFPPWKPWKAKV